MDYDPSVDPRHLPPGDELPQATKDRAEQEVAELEERMRMFDQMLLLFQQPGWGTLRQMYESTQDELDTMLVREQSPTQWKFVRGELAQVQAFLDMPEEIARRQRAIRSQHANLMSWLGKE